MPLDAFEPLLRGVAEGFELLSGLSALCLELVEAFRGFGLELVEALGDADREAAEDGFEPVDALVGLFAHGLDLGREALARHQVRLGQHLHVPLEIVEPRTDESELLFGHHALLSCSSRRSSQAPPSLSGSPHVPDNSLVCRLAHDARAASAQRTGAHPCTAV